MADTGQGILANILSELDSRKREISKRAQGAVEDPEMALRQLLENIAETLQKGTSGDVGDFLGTFGGVGGVTKLRPMQTHKIIKKATMEGDVDTIVGTSSSMSRANNRVQKLDEEWGRAGKYRARPLTEEEFTEINKHLLLPASIVE